MKQPTELTEHHHQLLVMSFASKHPIIGDNIYAIPNGGARNAVVAMKMKNEGQRKGMPDLCLPVAKKGYHGLYIELKKKGGRVSPEQREVIARLNANGYLAEVCFGAEAAIELLKDYAGIE